MSPEGSSTRPEPVNLLIGLFVAVAFGAWTVFSATDITTEVWAWMAVAGVGLIAAMITGAVAGPES